jgi:hypothetical protein
MDRRIFAGLCILFLSVSQASAQAAKPDEYAVQLSLSASLRNLSKAREEMQTAADDPKRAELLKNKLAVLEDEVRKKKRRLEVIANAPKAGQWLHMTDGERETYLREAHLPLEAADAITLYVMQYPMDSDQPLDAISEHVARRILRAQNQSH